MMKPSRLLLDEAHHIGRTQPIEPHVPIGNPLGEKMPNELRIEKHRLPMRACALVAGTAGIPLPTFAPPNARSAQPLQRCPSPAEASAAAAQWLHHPTCSVDDGTGTPGSTRGVRGSTESVRIFPRNPSAYPRSVQCSPFSDLRPQYYPRSGSQTCQAGVPPACVPILIAVPGGSKQPATCNEAHDSPQQGWNEAVTRAANSPTFLEHVLCAA
jgi:hypothetical protein